MWLRKMYQQLFIKIKIITFFICNAAARAYLKNKVGYNRKQRCEKCTIKSSYNDHRIIFNEMKQNYSPIVNNNFGSVFCTPYTKTSSPLLKINIILAAVFVRPSAFRTSKDC